jgi:peptidyl-prolyl cis-trans isomerase D
VAAARERLQEFKSQLDSGVSFDELAREYSEDPGSARQGGSLGAISRGVMDPAFEDAVFELAVGEVSGPVRSAFGLHLIKVDAINASKLPSFDEVSGKMRAEYQKDKAEQEFVDRVDIMATLAFENPDSLDAVADALGLIPSLSDWISPMAAANSGIGGNPAVLAVAFNADVLQDGYNSEPIELDSSRVIVLRVAEHRPSRQQPLEEARERIERVLAAKEARKLAGDTGRALLEQLQNGEDKQSVAARAELDWSGEAEFARNSPNADPGLLSTVFRMPRPLPGQMVFSGTQTAGGDFVVVALRKVVDGSISGDDKEQQTAARRNLEADAGRASYDAVVQTLRDNADVEIFRENL